MPRISFGNLGVDSVRNALGNLRYAMRQFRHSPVFTAAAVVTLALGIGGTTAIFSLMHAVMLRSLPVTDPASLYRVGEGDECCVEGGPQDVWGFYSFPLYVRLMAAAPEFEVTAAFQAGRGTFSVRRSGEQAARPLHSEYVTGTYFSLLGVGAFGGRLLTPEDDQPSASPVAVLSHHAWQTTYGRDTSVVGSSFVIEGHPFTIVGVAPPGFFGETLRSDPLDLWIPLHQEPMIAVQNSLLLQPESAWLRMMGRLRPGASTNGMSARLTALLRQWMQTGAAYPANWMPDVIRTLPKQVINVIPAGAVVGRMLASHLLACRCHHPGQPRRLHSAGGGAPRRVAARNTAVARLFSGCSDRVKPRRFGPCRKPLVARAESLYHLSLGS